VTKPNPENCKNCSSKCAYDGAQLQYTIQNRTVLIISPLTSRPTRVQLQVQYKCRETWAHASDGIDEVVVNSRFSLSNHFPADRWRRRWRDQELLVTLRRLQESVVRMSCLYRWLNHTGTQTEIKVQAHIQAHTHTHTRTYTYTYKYNAVQVTVILAVPGTCCSDVASLLAAKPQTHTSQHQAC